LFVAETVATAGDGNSVKAAGVVTTCVQLINHIRVNLSICIIYALESDKHQRTTVCFDFLKCHYIFKKIGSYKHSQLIWE
jgi:hypothetical protein